MGWTWLLRWRATSARPSSASQPRPLRFCILSCLRISARLCTNVRTANSDHLPEFLAAVVDELREGLAVVSTHLVQRLGVFVEQLVETRGVELGRLVNAFVVEQVGLLVVFVVEHVFPVLFEVELTFVGCERLCARSSYVFNFFCCHYNIFYAIFL